MNPYWELVCLWRIEIIIVSHHKYQTNMRNLNDCITHPVHKKIAEVYDKAVTPEELEAAKRYQHEVQDAITPEEKKEYNEAMITDFRRMMAAMDEDIAELQAEAFRKKMGDMPKFINLSQIARVYFGKSQSWLMQRINGNKVNGKEARFTPAEVKQLEAAFHDLGHKFLAMTF